MSAFPAAYLVLTTDLGPAAPLPGAAGLPNIPPKGHAFRLQPGKNVIGRLPDPDIGIVLPAAGVSRRHSQVELLSTGRWELEDLGSRNGTHVNGQQLQPHSLMPLTEGDRIRIAGVELTFHFSRIGKTPDNRVPPTDNRSRRAPRSLSGYFSKVT